MTNEYALNVHDIVLADSVTFGAGNKVIQQKKLTFYVGDHGPGQTTGQGLNQFGALWYVLGPGGNATTSHPTTPAPASGPGSSSYGY